MNIRFNRPLVALLFCTLAACGGGGGGGGNVAAAPGSGSAPPPASTPPSGGGGAVGVNPLNSPASGLVAGGFGVFTDISRVGVRFDVAVGGTGAWMGDIQGFGSIILNDNVVTTTGARFVIEGASGQQSDLRQGQQVLLVGTPQDNTATEVHYRANVKGPIAALTLTNAADGIATITILGQRVLTDAATVFANVDLAALAPGNLIEVSGNVNSAGDLVASYVERKSQLGEYKVIGTVGALTSSTFTITGLTVNFSGASINDFPNNTIAARDVVEVRGNPSDFTAPASFRATAVQRLPALVLGSDAVLRLEGLITRFDSASSFEIQGTPIITNNATQYVNGDAISLALNVKVQIEGQGNGNGSILASKVTIQSANAIRAEGDITAINTTDRTISLLGVTFQIRDLTRLEDDSRADVDPMGFANFNVGDEVEVRGYLDASTLVATRIEREDAQNRARLRGPVTTLDRGARTLSILGVPMVNNPTITEYRDLTDAPVTQATFFDRVQTQSVVRATWDNFNATTDVVNELALED